MEWLRAPLVSEVNAADFAIQQKALNRRAPNAAHRLLQLDVLRGVIMIVMAWDHSRDLISDRTLPVDKGSEMWSGALATYDDNFGLWFQRFLPHFCAPGFFWLMGVGMAFFDASRRKQFDSGVWSNWRIVKHFTVRGLLLILMDRVVTIPWYVTEVSPNNWIGGFGLPGNPALRGLLSIFEVLTALGMSMLVCGMMLPFFGWLSARVRYIRNGVLIITGGQIAAFLLGCISFAISNIVVVHYQNGDPTQVFPFPRAGAPAQTFGDYLVRFLVLPGLYPQGVISYPLLPWISLNLWGLCAGWFFVSEMGRKMISGFCLVVGVTCWTLFLLIRTFGGVVGNYRGWPRGGPNRQENFLIAFLDVCKYPPSLAYALLTLGGVSLLCVVLDQLIQHLQRVGRHNELAHSEEIFHAGLVRSNTIQTPRHSQNGVEVVEANGHAFPRSYSLESNDALPERDLAPLTPPPNSIQTDSPVASITVHVVRPAFGDAADLQKIAEREQAQIDKLSTPEEEWCCSCAYEKRTLVEFPFWPLYAKVLVFPLLVFGRVPLFFYLVHWYLLALGSLFFHGVTTGIPLEYVPIWWLSLIVALFYVCAPYSSFKNRKGTDSLWRFL
jgi:uncharacterized membrane protein